MHSVLSNTLNLVTFSATRFAQSKVFWNDFSDFGFVFIDTIGSVVWYYFWHYFHNSTPKSAVTHVRCKGVRGRSNAHTVVGFATNITHCHDVNDCCFLLYQ